MSGKKIRDNEDNLLTETDGTPPGTKDTDVDGGEDEQEDGESGATNTDGSATTGEDGDDGDTKGNDGENRENRTAQYIKRLKRDKREAQRRAELAEAAAAEALAKSKQKPAPVRADFESDEAYIAAQVDYQVAQRIVPSTGKGQLAGFEAALVENGFTRADAGYLVESFDEAARVHKDFQTKVVSAKNVTKEILEGLLELDEPGKVLYWLTNHQEELDRIASSGDIRSVAVQLGRLEERLEKTGGKGGKTPRQTSNAPEPIDILDASRDELKGDMGDRLTDDEYFKRANKRLLKQRGLA